MTPNARRFVDAVKAGKVLSPRALGELIDDYKATETKRLAEDKVAAATKAEEVEMKLAIIAALKKAEIKVAGGSAYSTAMTEEKVPTVKDWTKFYAFIKKNDAFELLERRPSKAAVKERWDDGKQVPGVEAFPADKLSFTKLKG